MITPNPNSTITLADFATADLDGAVRRQRAQRVLVAHELGRVRSVLEEVEHLADAGHTLWGFLAYEAAAAFDPGLATKAPVPNVPLALFATLEPSVSLYHPGPWQLGRLRAELGRAAYVGLIERVLDHIATGATYQVNLTMRMSASFSGDPLGAFVALAEAQGVPGLAIDLGDLVIASASPELFLRRTGDRVFARPMKGTARRGDDGSIDLRRAADLRASLKERAENLMIVDMLRNDLGRVATPGSVTVPSLFELERYPTVWQMTSRIEARSNAGLVDLLAATFPCASVTGAPKRRTMELITELEESPRGAYTGVIGRIGPGRDLDLQVAIRTAVITRSTQRFLYGVGSGVTWDSRPHSEHAECLAKARIATAVGNPQLRLLETLRVSASGHACHAIPHLKRMSTSAARLGFRWPADALATVQAAAASSGGAARLRVQLSRAGTLTTEHAQLPKPLGRPVRLALALAPVPRDAWSLAHKTTDRAVYERLEGSTLRQVPEADEVLLWSEDSGITETTIANLVYSLAGRWWTPPATGQLLPGIARALLLARGRVTERPLALAEIEQVERWVLVSSLRGLRPAQLLALPPAAASR